MNKDQREFLLEEGFVNNSHRGKYEKVSRQFLADDVHSFVASRAILWVDTDRLVFPRTEGEVTMGDCRNTISWHFYDKKDIAKLDKAIAILTEFRDNLHQVFEIAQSFEEEEYGD